MVHVIYEIEKTFKLPNQDKRAKHKLYYISCKLGTMPNEIWIIDNYPEPGQPVIYVENYDLRTFPISALGQEAFHVGVCDRVNDDGYAFILR